ncbi:hypothetical protein [Bifidobacterium catulorum]|uniref:Uncharacterized protein n=1 Tax=Bifidobacterium catulorum TaxID=1630173 RepID=A0A2U2MTT4_9BIFI|nr:hypothetical protein [Bifidobacterium catulorum]PWG60280.1 hypothetical protein DF200_03510 [Bifidobacterium catulorum]
MTTTPTTLSSIASDTDTATFDDEIIYYDDFDFDDDSIPPTKKDDDDGGDDFQCAYECSLRPEFYIKAYGEYANYRHLETFHYCTRHYALCVGYLSDIMSQQTPDCEQRRYVDHGLVPLRYQIVDFGRIGETHTEDNDETQPKGD